MSNARQEAIAGYERLAFYAVVTALVLLSFGYFIIGAGVADDSVSTFLQGIISNLLASLLVIAASYGFLRAILRVQRQIEDEEAQNQYAQMLRTVLADPANHHNAGQISTSEVTLAVVNELRDAISDGRISGLVDPPVQGGLSDTIDAERRLIIGHILHATSLALIYPKDQTQLHFRTFCHLADTQTQTLKPACFWSLHHTDDYNAIIPYVGLDSEPFVIAQAFNSLEMVRKNLPPDHLQSYPASLRGKIMPSLQGVLAIPISDFEPDTQSRALGTISIDSTQRLEELGFHDDRVKDVLVWCAKAVHQVLIMRDSSSRGGS